uniref:Si:ch211-168d1.3 n=1 Tax=Seriola lalandi dorsalis TaxID=1841481 RepID=A0A3B4WV68_SERLL
SPQIPTSGLSTPSPPPPPSTQLLTSLALTVSSSVGSTQRGSPRAFSVLDRLLLTHPVWLQLSLKQDTALYILLREPVGVSTDQSWSSLIHVGPVSTKETLSSYQSVNQTSSALSFPDLCRLVAFYCISRDVLPFPLELPEAIAKATTHRQLEAISHMGQGTVTAYLTVSLALNNNRYFSQVFLAAHFVFSPQLTNHSASNKRHRFKRSIRLRLSESSMNLSLEGVGSYSPPPSVEQPGGSERLQKTGTNSQRRVHAGAGVLRRTPAVSPGSAEEEDLMSSLVQTQTHIYQRPPLMRSRGRGGLHRMSEAFVCFFAPDKRLTRLVEELSRDRRSIFGGMVQDFLLEQREVLKSLGLRLFLSQAKCCLLDSGELEPPIETLVPENEKAMFSCVLRPLKSHLEKALVALHNHDGSSQCLTRNLLRLKGDAAMERLGVRTGVPDGRGVERMKQKLILMQRTHSPIDKVLLLLQVCKCVHKAMGSLHGQEVSWEDFLPSLSYVIVECNRPHILIEVEYMMELLEPSWLGGEGTIYISLIKRAKLTIFFFFFIFSRPSSPPPSLPPSLQRCVRILFQDGERSAVRTLQWRAGETSQALAQLCASTFGVSDPQQYTLYWRSGGEMRALPPQAQPQDLASHSEGGPSLSYLRTDHDFSKMRRLTRGGAVDLSESVCEE